MRLLFSHKTRGAEISLPTSGGSEFAPLGIREMAQSGALKLVWRLNGDSRRPESWNCRQKDRSAGKIYGLKGGAPAYARLARHS